MHILTISAEEKFKTLNELVEIDAYLKKQGKISVMTAGCFDLIHAGHVEFLEKSRALGII